MRGEMEHAKALIRQFEGCKLSAYTCPAGKETIGYGHVLKPHEPKQITKEQAERLLDIDCAIALLHIRKHVKISLSEKQTEALVSFVFNIGAGNFETSTLLKKLNCGDIRGAGEEFLRWNKARVNGKMTELAGLSRRRKAERELFLS